MGSDANWERLGRLLRNAVKACREVCPDAGIIIHSERVAEVEVLLNFYSRMKALGVDYDIIGLSYYPYFHGSLATLDRALSSLENDFPEKDIMIVETGYSYKWEVPGTNQPVDYPYSEQGQEQFAKDLVAVLLSHPRCNGLFWWWMEYNAFNTSLSGWYNAPLFNSETGRATPAFSAICAFGSGHGNNRVDEIWGGIPTDGRWFDLQGHPLSGKPEIPGIYIHNRKLIVITKEGM